VILALVVLVQALSLEEQFVEYAKTYNKKYDTLAETMQRFANFKASLARIATANAESTSAKYGLNQFSDMTYDEIKRTYLTHRIDVRFSAIPQGEFSIQDPPASKNWVTAGKVSPIKNQGQCGSCWAFASACAIESLSAIYRNKLPSLSEQQLVDCSSDYGNQGCNGGFMSLAFNYVKNKGLCTEDDYPYVAKEQSCKASKCSSDPNARIAGWKNVKANNEVELKNAVAQQPITVALDASQAFMDYQSGVFDGSCTTSINHAVVVVGYGTDSVSGKKYWLVRNSWGTWWGENGYIRILRTESTGKAGKCGIAQYPYYPVY